MKFQHNRHKLPRVSAIEAIERRMRDRKALGIKSPYAVKVAQQIGTRK